MKTENVWDYPRPPKCEPFSGHIRIIHRDILLADTHRALRILETSHPPTYYLPPEDVRMEYLQPNSAQTFCEFKGRSQYYDGTFEGERIKNLAWAYPSPSTAYTSLAGFVSFYASKLDACYVNDEKVMAQEGDFYGGWITRNLKGPFKGGAGTWAW